MSESEIKFQTEAQESCYRKVSEYLGELSYEVRSSDTHPSFYMDVGSATVGIRVTPWKTHDASIVVGAWVIQKVKLTPELKRYLLRENYNLLFGGFGVDEDDDIYLEHTIVGSTCDIKELDNSIIAIGVAADKQDDIIKDRWGGERAID